MLTASSSRRATVLGAVALLAVAGACRRRPAAAPTPVDPAPSSADSAARVRDSIDAAQRERALRDSAELARQQAAARAAQAGRDSAMNAMRASLLAPVYFDYDAAELRDDTREALEAKLPLLTRNAGLRLRVAGHTDDRGADEYNLALGQRRAAAVKRFFTERGIDASRLEIVSFGKERGTCDAQDESCWSRNRRAEFEVAAGGEALVAPDAR